MLNKYLNYNNLSDIEKGNIIIEMIKMSYETIKKYLEKLNYYGYEDFIGDVSYLIIEIFTYHKFKFDFYKTKKELYLQIVNNSFEKNYYSRYIKSINNKKQDFYSKEFIYSIFNDYCNYTFLCKLKAYINKCIYNIYLKHIKQKTEYFLFIDELSSKNINNHHINVDNIHYKIDIIYLNQDEQKLIKSFIKNNKILTQCEVANEIGINNKTISKRLKRIKNKMYSQ